MDPLPLRKLIEVSGGRWLSRRGEALAPPPDVTVERVSTDSRTVASGDLFVPISGENFDGHQFVPDVAPIAVAAFVGNDRASSVCSRMEAAWATDRSNDFGLILVDDTLDALERLACWYRGELPGTVVAITGSVGKTTVKEFVGQTLSRCFETVRARKSFNNRLGVALTILEASRSTQYLVVEMGTSAPGEIATLGEIVRPQAAVVTGVAPAHLSGLRDLQGVAREKAEIFRCLRPDGLAFLPAPIDGESFFLEAARAAGARVVRFGWSPEAGDLRYRIVSCETLWSCGDRLPGYRFEIQNGNVLELRLPGRHNVLNALATIAVVREVGADMDWRSLRDAVEGMRLPPLRLDVTCVGGVTIVDDTYNANPASLEAAIGAVADMPRRSGGRWFMVLGDLLELGPTSADIHGSIGKELARRGLFSRLWTVGGEARAAADVATSHGLSAEVLDVDDREALVEGLLRILRPGDGVLFKASRGVALDRGAAELRARLAGGGRRDRRTEKGRNAVFPL